MATVISFAPVYQILASFFIIFVAIEYAKSYTSIISKHIFDVEGIHGRYQHKSKIDAEMIKYELGDTKWSTGKGLAFKQKFIGDIENYQDKVEEADKRLQELKKDKYEFESFRYISIYMFVYCMTCLYAGGLCQGFEPSAETNFLLYYSSISSIIVSAYFLLGRVHFLFNTNTRIWNILVLTLLIMLCFIVTPIVAIYKPIFTDSSDSVLQLLIESFSAFLPSLVFIIGIIIVYFKSYKISTELKNTYSPLLENREELMGQFNNMKTSAEIDKQVEKIEVESED